MEELELSFHRDHTDANSINAVSGVTVFEDTLNLQRLSLTTELSHKISKLNPLSFNLPWAQLTHLNVSGHITLPFTSTHELLLRCTNLVSCSLCIPEDDPSVGELPIIVLGKLEILAIINESGHLGQFLRSLLLPSLKRLTLAARVGYIKWHQADVVGLITRSACTIEALKTLMGTPDDLLLGLLEVMPSLMRLSIWETSIFPSIVRQIAHDNFLPQLMLLECAISDLKPTVKRLQEKLNPSSFMEPLDDDLTTLTIIFVPGLVYLFHVGRDGIERMKELERNWLKLCLKKKADEDFMNYLDREKSDSGGPVGVDETDESDAKFREEDESDSDGMVNFSDYRFAS